MAARAIATLSLTFGLVSIPVKVYSATESSSAVRFKLMGRGGARLRQQYVADEVDDGVWGWTGESQPAVDKGPTAPKGRRTEGRDELAGSRVAPLAAVAAMPARASAPPEPAPTVSERSFNAPVVERDDIVKGYEFEKGRFVLFTPAELKALQDASRQTIDIVSFVPERAVDPIYYDKAYFLAPDKRGEKTYSLLLAAMQRSERCALAKWAWRAKEYVVQIRPAEGGMVLQQLLYADEVRSLHDLDVPLVAVGDAELKLALQLIEQGAQERYDPTQFVDEEKQRILAAVEQKIAGREIVASEHAARPSGQVIDLLETLRASLRQPAATSAPRKAAASAVKPSARRASAKLRPQR